MKKISEIVLCFADPILKIAFNFFPIKRNKVTFNSYSGSGFGDNPKYVALALLRKRKGLDLVWISKGKVKTTPNGIREVKNHSLRAAYELATSKVWVNNCRNTFKTKKRKGQYYVQTWHGTMDVKKVEGQVLDKLGKDYVRDSKVDGKITDVMISNSEFMTNQYKNWYWYNGKILEVGSPRMDIVLHPTDEVKHKVLSYFNLDKNYMLVLYAPTFRKLTINKKDEVWQYRFNYGNIIKCFEKKYNKRVKLLVRLHPNVANKATELKNKNIVNASKYPDMQELLATCDCLITDYSSCMFDFIISKKPVFLFAKDYSEYMNLERGLNFDVRKLPAPFSIDEEKLKSDIFYFNLDQYKLRCDEVINKLGIVESGNASDVVADKIIDVMDEK